MRWFIVQFNLILTDLIELSSNKQPYKHFMMEITLTEMVNVLMVN